MTSVHRAASLLVAAGAIAIASGSAGAAAEVMPAATPPLELVSTIPMPGVQGRIDHLAADPAHHRLFVAALGNDTVEVLDTASRRGASVRGLGAPQGVLFLPESNRLIIANGGANRMDIVDAASLRVVGRIDGLEDADNVRFDAAARTVLVGYGKGALRIVDAASGQSGGDIALPGHPESFQLERRGSRAFVNVPSSHSIFVVDRTKRVAVARWATPDAAQNFPMALDEDGDRLFVGARSPPVVLVYDTGSGKVMARLAIGRDTDDLFFDAARNRLYVICGEGRVDVFQRDDGDRYVRKASVGTASRARTGLFVPDEGALYVAAPALGDAPARILVYRVH